MAGGGRQSPASRDRDWSNGRGGWIVAVRMEALGREVAARQRVRLALMVGQTLVWQELVRVEVQAGRC